MWVESSTSGGLVEDENLWVVDERLGQTDTLAVAFGELADTLVAFGRETHQLYHVFNTAFAVFDAIDAGGEAEELPHIHVKIKRVVLGQVAYLPPYFQGIFIDAVATYCGLALGGWDVAGEDFHQRGFARPVGAEQSDHFTLFDGKTDVVQGALPVIDFGNMLYFYHIIIA